ncbi:MAG: hypothetical protein ACOYOB_06645 [Myxococcota bacterium]
MHLAPLRPLTPMCALLLAAALLPGCLTSGVYRTARTLDPGAVDMALSMSATRYQTPGVTVNNPDGSIDTSGGETTFLPNIFPEVSIHVGADDDLEIGGRFGFGSMMAELDAKYRFFQEGGLHLALAPAVAYRALLLYEGPSVTLPLIATFDLNDHLAINLAPYVGWSNLSLAGNQTNSDLRGLEGNLMTTGASAGVELRAGGLHVMPSVDWLQTVWQNIQTGSTSEESFLILTVTVGYGGGGRPHGRATEK